MIRLSKPQVNLGESVTVLVQATDNVGLVGKILKVNGTVVALNATGSATLTFNATGSVALHAEATDAAGNLGSVNATLSVVDPAVTSDPTASLSIAGGARLTQITTITGSVNDPVSTAGLDYVLSLIPHDGGDTKILATGTGSESSQESCWSATMRAGSTRVVRTSMVQAAGREL